MIFIDRFDSVAELRGEKRTYENIKKLVLKVGRFSVSDIETGRDGVLFTRLCKDPDIEIYKKAYPWTYVRKITHWADGEMGTIRCKRDYVMENGPAAFLAGKDYPWRWTTEAEQDDNGCHVALHGELGPDHFLAIIDVLEFFESDN